MRIVIFDDDADVLFVCAYYFRAKGWTVDIFTSCEAIETKVSASNPDVILMDNWIPDIGGVAATQTLKKHPLLSNIPVIFFTANSDIEQLATTARADRYIRKPFQFVELEKIITGAVSDRKNLHRTDGQANA